eukprot:7478281-Lingulodinium_polyedra.AAC.1
MVLVGVVTEEAPEAPTPLRVIAQHEVLRVLPRREVVERRVAVVGPPLAGGPPHRNLRLLLND